MNKEFSKTVLVTGGAGFVGSHLSAYLTYAGHKVTSVDISSKDNAVCEHIISDVGSFINSLMVCEGMPRLFPNTDEYDYIFHLASTNINQSDYPESVIGNNVNSLLAILQYCRFHPHTKLIFVSDGALNWTDVMLDAHLLSKHMCEEMIYTYIKCFSVEATCVRLYTVYGANDFDYGTKSSLVQQIKNSLIQDVPFAQYGDETTAVDFVHVSDAVIALESIMFEMEESWQPVYEIGSGQPVKIHDILTEIKNTMPDMQIVNFPRRLHDPIMTKADASCFPKGWKHKMHILDYFRQWINSGCPKD